MVLTFNSLAMAQDCVPTQDSCGFYLCLEDKMQCGYNGYPLRLGYRFCREIEKMKVKSVKLNLWLNTTRYCLQEKLMNKTDLQCNQLAYSSVKDHVSCYLDNGYCDLAKGEKKIIQKYISKSILKAPKFIFMNAKALLSKGCNTH